MEWNHGSTELLQGKSQIEIQLMQGMQRQTLVKQVALLTPLPKQFFSHGKMVDIVTTFLLQIPFYLY